MKIAVDIDGVLNYIEKFQLEHGITWFRKKGYEVVNPNGFDIMDIFECTEEVRNEFWKSTTEGGIPIVNALVFELAKNLPMRPGFKELLKQLYDNGDNAYIVTERYGTNKRGLFAAYNKKLVYKWLKNNGIDIPKDRIIFVPEGKTKKDIYEEIGIEVILEDKVENIKAIEEIEFLYAIVFNASYNKGYSNEKAFRVDLPAEAFSKIKEIEKIKNDVKHQKEIVRPNQFYPTTGKASIDRVYRQYIFEEDENLNIPEMKMVDYLRKCAENFKDTVMLKDGFGHSYTYDQFLNNLVPLYAKAFKNYGVEDGEPVVIALPNVVAAVAAKFALNEIGAIPVMANPLSNAEEFANYLSTEIDGKKVRTALLFNRSYNEVKIAIENPNVELKNIVNIGVNSDFNPLLNFGYKLSQGKYDPKNSELKKNKLITNLKEFLDGAKNIKTYEKAPYVEGKTATVYFTGGTTGKEKGVETTDKNAIAVAMAFTRYIKGEKVGKLTVNAMPFFHVYGDNQIFYFAACNGMTNLLIAKFNKNEVPKLFTKHGDIVNCNGVPAFLQAIYDKLEDESRLSSVENMISGGSILPKEFTQKMNIRLKRSGSKASVGNGYGSTESDGGLSYTLVGADETGCIGIPTPGTNLKIVKPGTTEEVSYGIEGEICANGPSIMKGYLNNNEDNEKALKVHEDGKLWLHTGDLGFAKENGKFYITDRIKRMIIVSGENVYPTRIEQLIVDTYSDIVDQCFVISRTDGQKGEVPVAKVLLRPNVQPTEKMQDDIINTCKAKFTNKKYWPVQLDFVKTIPLTKMSKPDYKVLDDPELIIEIEKENKNTKINRLKDNYAGNRFYKAFSDLYSPLYKSKIFGRELTYIGEENIPKRGAGIFAMNHLNVQDQNAVLANVDRIVSLPAKIEYFDGKLSNYFMTKMEMIPVDRFGDVNYAKEWIKGLVYTIPFDDFEKDNENVKQIINYIDSIDRKTTKHPKELVDVVTKFIEDNYSNHIGREAVEKINKMPTSGVENGYGRALKINAEVMKKLNSGRLVGVFPEGTRNNTFTESGILLPFHSGAVYWARDSYAPIIPTAITGEHKRGGKIIVRFGSPIKIDSELTDSEVKEATNDLRNKVYELVLMNLIEQDTLDNNKALVNAIKHLQKSNDAKDKDLLDLLAKKLSEKSTERNSKILNILEQ